MGNKSFSETYLNFEQIDWGNMQQATIDTLFMTFFSMVLVIIIGLLLGLALYSLGRKSTTGASVAYNIVSIVSNAFRSTPFMILIS